MQSEEAKKPKELEWIEKRRAGLSVYFIEKQLGMAQKTLHNHITGYRNLNPKWFPAIIKWVKDFKK